MTAAVLALGLVLPASAAAQTGTDPCRSNGAPHSFCVGMEKLAERASAECRRPGVVADSQCATPVGRRVDRTRVDAFEQGWAHRALSLQYELANDVPLANAPWVGTHNSFNSPSELPTVSTTDSNQQLSLVDQLRLGVRSLELDVHWFPSAWGPGFAPVVCHATDQHGGCTTERPLGDVLEDIAGWLDAPAHRDQVLLIYLEDDVGDPAGYDGAAAAIEASLGARVYRPDPPAGGCEPMPLDLDRDAVLAAGKQVLLVSDCGPGGWAEWVFDWASSPSGDAPHVEANAAAWSGPCGQFSRATFDTRLVRYYEDSTWVGTTPAGGTFTPSSGISPQDARDMALCGVDLTGFDQLLPDDGRLEALVWSWAPGEPAAAGDCSVQRPDGRWEARDCAEVHAVACRAGTDWIVAGAVPYADASTACSAAGATPAVPRTGRENELLRAAAGGAEVWLGQTRAGSSWAAADPR